MVQPWFGPGGNIYRTYNVIHREQPKFNSENFGLALTFQPVVIPMRTQDLDANQLTARKRFTAEELKSDEKEFYQLVDSIDDSGNIPANIPAKRTPFMLEKRNPRRCGALLIKHIQKVCNGCLKSPDTESFPMKEKRKWYMTAGTKYHHDNKRNAMGGVGKITEICCTSRACADDEVKPFCCQ
ncbi:hypothetical protein Ddc_04808 [Ditylenchus destructor]|nr:hypothetical protein Ddc_04808 [Ditylenchus destructor]